MVPTAQIEIEDSCNKIIKNVRSTRLNYGIHETPHSICFTIRKSLNKSSKIDDSVIELEKKSDYIETLENKVQILHEKLVQSTEETTTNVSNKVKGIEEEKRLLQVKHEKVCAEFKNLKMEIKT
jgi:hypothetical protein